VGASEPALEERAFPEENNRLFLKQSTGAITSFKKVSSQV
jgi:hypothetical protein